VLVAIKDAPRNLQISPNQSIYHPGDKIQCSAEGKPAPSYQWTDLVSGTVIQGDVLDITEDMVNRSHTFQCTASNQYKSKKSSSLNFTVAGIVIVVRITCVIKLFFHICLVLIFLQHHVNITLTIQDGNYMYLMLCSHWSPVKPQANMKYFFVL